MKFQGLLIPPIFKILVLFDKIAILCQIVPSGKNLQVTLCLVTVATVHIGTKAVMEFHRLSGEINKSSTSQFTY